MKIDKSITSIVFRYGKMKYSAKKICDLLGLDQVQRAEFTLRFEDPNDEIHIKYHQGLAIGEYRMERLLEKEARKGNIFAITELGTRQYHRRINELKTELFES